MREVNILPTSITGAIGFTLDVHGSVVLLFKVYLRLHMDGYVTMFFYLTPETEEQVLFAITRNIKC